MEQDEAILVERSQRGELAAFNSIVERYQTQVYNVAARILGYRAAADDVTQETFISAFRSIGRFRGGSLRAWLLRIATNASYDHIRARGRRRESSLDEALENQQFTAPSSEESPEQHAIRRELGEELQRAILTLPQDQRTTLVLIDVQGLSYEEAAESTDISLGTVKSRLSRARSRMREALTQRQELLPERYRRD